MDNPFFTHLDIDECGINNGNCHANANCQNTVGSVSCTCKSGYNGNGLDCSGKNILRTIVHIRPFSSSCFEHCMSLNSNDVLGFNLEIGIVAQSSFVLILS